MSLPILDMAVLPVPEQFRDVKLNGVADEPGGYRAGYDAGLAAGLKAWERAQAAIAGVVNAWDAATAEARNHGTDNDHRTRLCLNTFLMRNSVDPIREFVKP